jgi:ribonuclease III
MPDLSVVFRTPSEMEADMVQGLLKSHGIDCWRTAGPPPGVFPFASSPLGDTCLSVREADAAAALRVLAAPEASATDVTPDASPQGPVLPELSALEACIGYQFRQQALLAQALTHKSRAHEDVTGEQRHNESLEFLGDAVLGLLVAEALCERLPETTEGQKSQLKAALVSTTTLTAMAERVSLGAHLRLGRGEEKTGGRQKPALLADACEALIAALYLDGGLEPARRFVLAALASEIEAAATRGFRGTDFKSRLQEVLQRRGQPLPTYEVVATAGPDHRKVFTVEVRVTDRMLATAEGLTKKDAEQQAAALALAGLADETERS